MGYKKTDAIQTLLEEFAEDKSVINKNYIDEMHQHFTDNLSVIIKIQMNWKRYLMLKKHLHSLKRTI
jgi:hypothetical protein